MFYDELLYTTTSNNKTEEHSWREVVIPMYNGYPIRELYDANGNLVYDGLNLENEAVRYYLKSTIIQDPAYNTYTDTGNRVYQYTKEGIKALHNDNKAFLYNSNGFTHDFKTSVFYAMWMRGNLNDGDGYGAWSWKYTGSTQRLLTMHPTWTNRPAPIVVNAEGGTKVRVSTDSNFNNYYDFSVGTNVELEDPENPTQYIVESTGPNCTCLYNLIPNTKYYYRVLDQNDTIIKESNFTTRGRLRMIALGNVNNVRDLGGWPCEGGHLAYGKLYRGCGLSTSTDLNSGKSGYPSNEAKSILVNQLNVKKVIDLRTRSGTQSISLPNSVTIVNVPMDDSAIYGDVVNSSANRTAIKNVLNSIAASLNNGEAVYFCCNHGQDRTGTIACIIELICGCDYVSIIKDWEVSAFHANYLPSATCIYKNSSATSSTKLVSTLDFIEEQSVDTTNVDLMNWLNSVGVGSSDLDTINTKCLAWLYSIGVSSNTINSIKANMIIQD